MNHKESLSLELTNHSSNVDPKFGYKSSPTAREREEGDREMRVATGGIVLAANSLTSAIADYQRQQSEQSRMDIESFINISVESYVDTVAETGKFVAETGKFVAETGKFVAETGKLAETGKFVYKDSYKDIGIERGSLLALGNSDTGVILFTLASTSTSTSTPKSPLSTPYQYINTSLVYWCCNLIAKKIIPLCSFCQLPVNFTYSACLWLGSDSPTVNPLIARQNRRLADGKRVKHNF